MPNIAIGGSFQVTAQLTGDPRPNNPDSLIVDVTIAVVDNMASWTIDINSPLHSTIKLDEFYFNIANIIPTDITFTEFIPLNWAINTPATTAGGGNISFLFEALDPSGPPNAADVTNTQNLTFKMTGTSNFLVTDFTNAPFSTSNDQTLGSGQLGAHVQSLSVNNTTCPQGGCSNSGFVLGAYDDGTGTGSGDPVPEPSTMLLFGSGLVALGWWGRKKQLKKN